MMMDRDPFGLDGMIELPPTLRLTHEQAEAEPHLAAEFLAEFPHGEVIVDDTAECPHCAAAGITVTPDGIAPTGDYRARRKARRQAERKARRRNR